LEKNPSAALVAAVFVVDVVAAVFVVDVVAAVAVVVLSSFNID